MGTNGASEVNLAGTSKEECSETTVEIKIKTLDSQTYTLRVDKYVPVPALKEQIADITGVLSEQQRLICRGKVLKDDQLLSAYHVEDGHTLHLVVRQPIDSSSASMPRSIGSDNGINSGSNLNHSAHSGNLVFGPINLPDQGDPAASDLSRIFSSVISSLGVSSFGTGSAREQAFERNGRTSGSGGPSDSSQPQTDQASARAGFDSYVGGLQFPNATSLGNQHPTVIPDSCTTLTQYMDHMRHEFVSIGRDLNNNSQSTGTDGGEGHDSHLHSATRQGLPTPASLAEVIQSARQLLIENTASCLSDLAAQLQDQGSVVDPQARATIQSNIMRSGVLIQNLGPLLLELGRTIMTLRVGQTPEEAIVNAGPAIFVSATSPNPIMVQAGTSFSGISMGALHPGHIPTVSLGPGLISRNIDITIRRAQASDNLEGQTGGQQPSERTAAASTVHQAFQGISGRASAAREPTVHVVPIRTVIAIPGVNHRPSDSSGSADTSLRPLRARLQQQIPGNTNDARNPLASSEQRVEGSSQHSSLDLTNEYVERIQNILSTSSTSTALEHARSQHGNSGVFHVSTQGSVGSEVTEAQGRGQFHQDPVAHPSNGFRTMEQSHATNSSLQTTAIASDADQTITSTEEHVLSRQDNEAGVFFSALVRQLMPLLSENAATENSVDSSLHPGSSMEQVEDQSSAAARRRPDSPNAPASKRQKRD